MNAQHLSRTRSGPLALRRTGEMAAIFMIGDGLLGLTQPRRHVAIWRSDYRAVDLFVRPFAGKPAGRRLYGTLQIAAGLGLAALLLQANAKSAA